MTVRVSPLLLLVLTLTLAACNPGRIVTPQIEEPAVDENIIVSGALIQNYDGDDTTVYFLIATSDGQEALHEAGYIKDGKLTLNPSDPAAELQQLWDDTLPA